MEQSLSGLVRGDHSKGLWEFRVLHLRERVERLDSPILGRDVNMNHDTTRAEETKICPVKGVQA